MLRSAAGSAARSALVALVATVTLTGCLDFGVPSATPDTTTTSTLVASEAPVPDEATEAADLASADELTDADFGVACDGGPVEIASPYDATPGVVHVSVVLTGDGDGWEARPLILGAGWTQTWAPEVPMALLDVQLVVCLRRTASTAVRECTGYGIDAVGNPLIAVLEQVDYVVEVREAATGALVGSTRMSAVDADCPATIVPPSAGNITSWYSLDTTALAAFVQPFVAP